MPANGQTKDSAGRLKPRAESNSASSGEKRGAEWSFAVGLAMRLRRFRIAGASQLSSAPIDRDLSVQ